MFTELNCATQAPSNKEHRQGYAYFRYSNLNLVLFQLAVFYVIITYLNFVHTKQFSVLNAPNGNVRSVYTLRQDLYVGRYCLKAENSGVRTILGINKSRNSPTILYLSIKMKN